MIATVLLTVLSILLGLLYVWVKYNYSYWKRNRVPYLDSVPFIGIFKDVLLMKCSWGIHLANCHNHPKAKNQPIVGVYVMNAPGLIVRQPELIKRILVKDFSKFCNRYTSPDVHGDVLGDQNLFFIKNPNWKEVRSKLTPVFTSSRLKQMFPLITEIGNKMNEYLLSKTIDSRTKEVELEVRELSAAFANDVIASVAFGIDVNSFTNPKNEFRVSGIRIFNFSFYRALEVFSIFFVPKLVSILKFKVFSKQSSDFLQDTITHVIKEREKSGQVRNDLIDTLISFKKESEIDPSKQKFASVDFMVAQAAIFFSAGFETSSSTMSFALYELAKEPEIQRQLRDEIKHALKKTGGDITYEMILDMQLLDKVVNETLRLHPSLAFVTRECTLPAGEESYSLEPFSGFRVPNGMPVYISSYALQRDPNFYPNPNKFDPERFGNANKENINSYTYLPFGIGPHNCIGERLGLMQTKVGIISYLRNHLITTSPNTISEMVYEPKGITLQSLNGIYLNVIRDPLL